MSNQLLGWAVVPGTPLQVGSMFLLVLARKSILAILKRTLGKYGHFTSHLTLGSETLYRRISNSGFHTCIFTVEFEIFYVEQLKLKKLNHYT